MENPGLIGEADWRCSAVGRGDNRRMLLRLHHAAIICSDY